MTSIWTRASTNFKLALANRISTLYWRDAPASLAEKVNEINSLGVGTK
jgi:hypothetical protein